MIREIVVASNNESKIMEIRSFFKGAQVKKPGDFGFNDFDPVEDGNTFFENAMIKARELFGFIKRPVLADDSGICVDVLDGKPGIFSKRFFDKEANGRKLSDYEKNKMMVELVDKEIERKYGKENVKNSEFRGARFVCCMVLFIDENRFYVVQETMEGYVVDSESFLKSKVSGGLGYDPIFVFKDNGKIVAEMELDEKNSVSHRGKALEGLKRIVEAIL